VELSVMVLAVDLVD